MKNVKWLIGILWLAYTGCSKDNETLNNGLIIDPNYPTTYHKLATSEYTGRKNEYLKDKGCNFITGLNAFGFAAWADDFIAPCSPSCTPLSYMQAKQMAYAFLEKNKAYFGITDTSQLSISSLQHFDRGVLCNNKDSLNWSITFGNQQIKGMEVEGTSINLVMDSSGVIQATGHWYPVVEAPQKENYSYEQAKKKLTGKSFDFMCWSTIHLDITSQTQWDEASVHKRIYPISNDNSIELHVVWALKTGYFYFYVDVMTGELLGSFMTIIC